MNKLIYQWIIEVETMMLMKYKINIVESERFMTMIDLQQSIRNLDKKNEEIEKNSGKDNFSKCLVYLRDLLNYMTIKDDRIR